MEDVMDSGPRAPMEEKKKPEKPKLSVERQHEMAPLMVMAQNCLAGITVEELLIALRMARDVASSYQAFGCLLDPSNSKSKTLRHQMIISKMEAFVDLRKAMALHEIIDREVDTEQNTADLVSRLFG